MNDRVKGLVVGLTIGSLLTGATAFAATGININVVTKKLSIFIDGIKKTSTDGFIYKGTTYVPIKSVGTSLGKQVGLYDSSLYIGQQPTALTETKAIELLYSKIKIAADKYNLHYMIEESDAQNYYIKAFEDFPDHIATYGFYTVNKYTSKVTKYDIVSDKEIVL